MSLSMQQQRPLLTLHVGQAGIQIGHAAWELMCLEHNLEPDGSPKRECQEHGYVETAFEATSKGKYYPRSLFVDTDPFCVDEVRSGPYRRLFNSHQLISENLDSGANYATGRYGYVNTLLPDTLDRLRWLTEQFDVKPTIFLFHSSSGGTGSGFAVAALTNSLDELDLRSRDTVDFCVVPGLGANQNSCELLNTALYLEESQRLVRQTICVSNSALFRVCSAQLQSDGRATYAHVNRILAAAFSNLTATERLPGSSTSFHSILDSLLPYEHFKYPMLACAPYLTKELSRSHKCTVKSAAAAVLEQGSQFLDVDLRQGRLAAGFLLFRGDTNLAEVQNVASDLNLRNRVQFYDWVPSGFRTGVTIPPPLAAPNSGFASPSISVTLLASHSGISAVFSRLATAATKLHDLDLFVHRYEGAVVALWSRDEVSGDGATAAPSQTKAKAVKKFYTKARGYKEQRPRNEHSDPLNVRQRLVAAINFLQHLTTVYTEDTEGVNTKGSGGEPSVQLAENDSSVDSKVAVQSSIDKNEKFAAKKSRFQENQARDNKVRESKQPVNEDPEIDSQTLRFYSRNKNSNSSTDDDDSSDTRFQQKSRRKTPGQVELEIELPKQTMQSQNQLSWLDSDNSDLSTSTPLSSNSNSTPSISAKILQRIIGYARCRAALVTSIPRRSSRSSNGFKTCPPAAAGSLKDRNLPNQQFAWSPTPNADSKIDSKLAIALALSILEKYGIQQQRETAKDSDK